MFQKIMSMRSVFALSLAAGAMMPTAVSFGQFSYNLSYARPARDRWVYPFGDQAGTRTTASTYSTLHAGFTQFDDRDAELLMSFDTDVSPLPRVPSGFAPSAYRIRAAFVDARLTVTSGTPGFAYDNTFDALQTHYFEGGLINNEQVPQDPQYVPDADAGRPLELYGAGFRNGFTNLTWTESTPFSTAPAPARSTRTVFPIDMGGPNGADRDVSNNVTERFEVQPFALAQISSGGSFLAPGAIVPDDSVAKWDLTFSTTGKMYLARGLAQGRVTLLANSLHRVTAFGSGPVNYPVFTTKENSLYNSPRLVMLVDLCVADIGQQGGLVGADGRLDNNDFSAFVTEFFAGNLATADIGQQGGIFGRDGLLDNNDFSIFVSNFFSSACQ
jgi:hypothetical protein